MCLVSCAWNCLKSLKTLFKISLIVLYNSAVFKGIGLLVVAQSNNWRGVIVCCSYDRCKLVLAASRGEWLKMSLG